MTENQQPMVDESGPLTDEDVQVAVDKFAVAIARDLKINGDPDTLLISLLTQIKICAIFQRLITDQLDKLGIIPEAEIRRLLVAEVTKETEELRGAIALATADSVKRKRQ